MVCYLKNREKDANSVLFKGAYQILFLIQLLFISITYKLIKMETSRLDLNKLIIIIVSPDWFSFKTLRCTYKYNTFKTLKFTKNNNISFIN